jgi:HSP20 family protein
MATLSRWDPFGEMQRLTDQMFRAFGGDVERRTFAPAVDIYEDDAAICVKAELPGVKPGDVKISVENNVLTFSGERKLERSDEREGYHRLERSYGNFTRSFALPESIKADEVEADLTDGVLTLRIPKRAEVAPKRIEVKSHGEAGAKIEAGHAGESTEGSASTAAPTAGPEVKSPEVK